MATGYHNGVWYTWTSADYNTASSTTATIDIWTDWNTSASTSYTTSSSTTDGVWVTWNGDDAIEYTPVQRSIPAPSKEEQERRKLRLEQERKESEERQKRYDEMQRKREAAEKKAKALLLDLIGEDQLKVYEETGRVFVKGRKQDYIVQKQGTVIQIQKDKLVDMCVHLENRTKYPDTDNVVAMKIMLETDEDKVLKLANQHEYSKRDKSEMPLAACM